MFDFPAAPLVGDEYTSGGVTYIFTGTVWDLKSGGSLTDFVLKAGDTMTGPLNMAPGSQLTFGAQVAGSYSDLTKHIELYSGTNGMGINTTVNGQFNFTLKNAAHAFNFFVGAENVMNVKADGLRIPGGNLNVTGTGTFADKVMIASAAADIGYFIGDAWHGMKFNGSNTLQFCEYHDRFEWKHTNTTNNVVRMSLYGGNLSVQGNITAGGGIDMGSVAVNPTDVTRHISLWGNAFGFAVSSGTLNYVLTQSANKHDFWVGTQYVEMRIDNAGVNLQPMLAVNEWLGRGADDMVNVKEVFLALVAKVKQLETQITALTAQPRGRR
jgi:hypothetical protein